MRRRSATEPLTPVLLAWRDEFEARVRIVGRAFTTSDFDLPTPGETDDGLRLGESVTIDPSVSLRLVGSGFAGSGAAAGAVRLFTGVGAVKL